MPPAQPPDDILTHRYPGVFGHAFVSISIRGDKYRGVSLLINAEALTQMGTPMHIWLHWMKRRRYIMLTTYAAGGMQAKVAANHGGGQVRIGEFETKHGLALTRGRLRQFIHVSEGVFACGPVEGGE